MSEEVVEVFTDGACQGNPGPGGWGVLLRYQHQEKQLWGGEVNTTNNRMELLAAIMALETLKRPCQVCLTTDSQYLQKGITEWLPHWIKRGWKTCDKRPVKNTDLWQRLLAATQNHTIEWQWIRGHNGHIENEIADRLANRGLKQILDDIASTRSWKS